MTAIEPAARRIAPPPRVVVRATDLGGVAVLKHGDIYLLTDSFGDIHPDSRGLGLYAADTRILSCSVLTIDGARPALLRGDPSDKMASDRLLARQSLGITRHRVLGPGLQERLVIANFTDHHEKLVLELGLGFDAADIFEIRGYPRPTTGIVLPIVATRDR